MRRTLRTRRTRGGSILGAGLWVFLLVCPGSFALAAGSGSLGTAPDPADDPFYGEAPIEDPYGFDEEADALFDDEFDLEAEAPPGFPDPFERFNKHGGGRKITRFGSASLDYRTENRENANCTET